MNRDLDYVLNYMVKYTKDRFMQDSEPMLNHRDIELVLKHIYEIEEENKQLKEGLHKILDLNKRAINCDSQKITIKYLLKQYDLIYETLGELQPGLMKGDKENE